MSVRHVPGELSIVKFVVCTVVFFLFGIAIMLSLPIGAAAQPPGDAVQRELDQNRQAIAQIEGRTTKIEQRVAGAEGRLAQLERAIGEVRERLTPAPKPRSAR